ncbi:hypothetical protein DPMN_182195 [Dreissena polymorpha]|uniref:Mab-21-like HhH/H2TH-like domain-containing protein n=2 Tax=Dreissena polymorpha TaxID=45954 RepID=A0A9D4DFU5_DREPO|nr:hypothetical protein DPMN_182195 [Dreissena polymorpha]
MLSKSLSLNQKRCYMLFKYIFKFHINKVPRGLASFFCKVTFLWLCETKPAEEWKDESLLECLILLLGQLKRYLQHYYLPHYYIPDYNLVADMKKSDIDVCVRDLEKAMAEPWQIILKLTEKHRFRWLSRDVSLSDILKKVSSGVENPFFEIKNYLLSFFNEMLDKGEGLLVLSIISKQWHWASYIQVDTDIYIRHLEEMIAYLEGSGDLVCLKALLANLYHQREVERGGGNEGMKSCFIYKDTLYAARSHTWIYACFYDLLFYLQEYDLIIKDFIQNIKEDILYTPGMYSSITTYNRFTTQDFAEMLGHVLFPTTAYILYQVVRAYEALSQTSKTLYKQWLYNNEARKALNHLKRWTKRKCQMYPELFDDHLYFLVGKASEMVGDMETAEVFFKETLSYGISFVCIEPERVPVVPPYRLQILKGQFDCKLLRFQPYRKVKKRSKQHDTFIFKAGIARVGEYVHY